MAENINWEQLSPRLSRMASEPIINVGVPVGISGTSISAPDGPNLTNASNAAFPSPATAVNQLQQYQHQQQHQVLGHKSSFQTGDRHGDYTSPISRNAAIHQIRTVSGSMPRE